jgi:hypothetical protein
LFPGSVSTDGAGKIDGATTLRFIFNDASSNVLAIADLVTTVSGNIAVKGSTTPTPTATIQLKGNGTSIDSAGVIGTASLSLKFVGSPTNRTATGSVPLKGTFSGTVKVGLASINNGKPLKVDTTTTGSVGALAESVGFFGRVVQSSSKLFIVGNDPDQPVPLTGTGSVNTKKGSYTANLKGFGFAKGASLSLTGATADKTNVWFQFGTNAPVQVTIGVPATASAKGKLLGQTVNADGGVATLAP